MKEITTKNKWALVAISMLLLIFLIVGFMIGYNSANIEGEVCRFNPFSYGVKILNHAYNQNYQCMCIGKDQSIFSFSENKPVH